MTSSVGRNSAIMASGTAASRVTGLIRTILLAGALGTTGLAANAYQAGAMIPQVIFTLVSGGIFNAVLVPQIVRTLEHKDARDRLNKLITFSIALLAIVTVVTMALTPLLTRLYAQGGPELLALATTYTLWCMPQVFFYGLYTVLGQILASKNRFGMYAWSSVGANIISSLGLTAFIAFFGRAQEQPLEFWTPETIALIAGTATLGVAFQALILFVPLRGLGLKYRPRFGVRGIGLRSMGPVAAWSAGIIVVGQIGTVFNTRLSTSAPQLTNALTGISEFEVAGNASYQNAFSIYILPYSLIAVSVATAIFPKISKDLVDRQVDLARSDLSAALRSVGLFMFLFTTAFLAIPTPIILTLLPSVSPAEAQLMSGPLIWLAWSLPLSSAYLIIQRTFYAFEDGFHPFVFVTLQTGLQILVLGIGRALLPPAYWVNLIAGAVSISYLLAFPALVWMIRRRFEGRIDGRRITLTYLKTSIAALCAFVAAHLLCKPVYTLLGVSLDMKVPPPGMIDVPRTAVGSMNWLQALGSTAILGSVITAVYMGVLWLLKTDEIVAAWVIIQHRFSRLSGSAAPPA